MIFHLSRLKGVGDGNFSILKKKLRASYYFDGGLAMDFDGPKLSPPSHTHKRTHLTSLYSFYRVLTFYLLFASILSDEVKTLWSRNLSTNHDQSPDHKQPRTKSRSHAHCPDLKHSLTQPVWNYYYDTRWCFHADVSYHTAVMCRVSWPRPATYYRKFKQVLFAMLIIANWCLIPAMLANFFVFANFIGNPVRHRCSWFLALKSVFRLSDRLSVNVLVEQVARSVVLCGTLTSRVGGGNL